MHRMRVMEQPYTPSPDVMAPAPPITDTPNSRIGGLIVVIVALAMVVFLLLTREAIVLPVSVVVVGAAFVYAIARGALRKEQTAHVDP
ncbi:MAG TPA: hypothetical protein VK427_12560 [Kofleriaceae bacterium]|nr:hypothetical protein [Kofleriaceae bacterium]